MPGNHLVLLVKKSCMQEQFRLNLWLDSGRCMPANIAATLEYISMFQTAFQIPVKRKFMKNSPFYKYCSNWKFNSLQTKYNTPNNWLGTTKTFFWKWWSHQTSQIKLACQLDSSLVEENKKLPTLILKTIDFLSLRWGKYPKKTAPKTRVWNDKRIGSNVKPCCTSSKMWFAKLFWAFGQGQAERRAQSFIKLR